MRSNLRSLLRGSHGRHHSSGFAFVRVRDSRDSFLEWNLLCLPVLHQLEDGEQADRPHVVGANDNGNWTARITIEADSNEIADLVKARVNKLDAPFELSWQKKSWKAWDWRLVRVSNAALDLSEANF